MEELKITKEKVLEAASTCSQAASVLKTLFPEAFVPPTPPEDRNPARHGTITRMDTDGRLLVYVAPSSLPEGRLWAVTINAAVDPKHIEIGNYAAGLAKAEKVVRR